MSEPAAEPVKVSDDLRHRVALEVQQALDSVAEGFLNEVLKGKHTREEMTAAIRGSGLWDLEDTWIEAMEELDRDQKEDDDD